ncbi:hypothetical protein PUNSTDRAFT_137661 [Punctularia strigosozonata HHB-11173 SS5]|uniref:uncharacterized protein n=1 Tax=Punctularia strigosozonata (strain HHB-11173) TaxID=741275 RepID=UPI000441745B|nr:uncharacterized protein PUNSTDRAFT_137661 [Punctularia strigosozonata HHB-11173 SS5]EIN05553.1 hypothetical protein PUNSTDRAFT_137661 [Punctularia strigosozonata HHB-11173 SS5]
MLRHPSNHLWNDWYERLAKIEPQNIEFTSNGKDITVFSTFSGQIHTFSRRERTLEHGPSLAQLIGYVTMGKDREVVIDNTNNFSLHNSKTGALVAMFGAGSKISAVPKHVMFGKDREIVVAGSDTGCAYVFQKAGGGPEQILMNASDGYTQIVTTSSTASANYIACATSSTMGVGAVSIWTCKRVIEGSATLPNSTAGTDLPGWLWKLLQQIWQRFKGGLAWLSNLVRRGLVWLAKLVMTTSVILLLVLVVAPFLWSMVEDDVPEAWMYAKGYWYLAVRPAIVSHRKRIAELYGFA